jgi:formylglycine-generating enzyme required for sulfatase activity
MTGRFDLRVAVIVTTLCTAAFAALAVAAPRTVTHVGDFVRIPAGTFVIGSPPDEPGRFDDEMQHRVTLTRPFELCDHHVTQVEWHAVMGWNDSAFPGDSTRPVENVTWFDGILYCNARSRAEHRDTAYVVSDAQFDGPHCVSAEVRWIRTANGYRLPTEAEWEFACRARTTTAYYNGPLTASDPARCTEDRGLDAIGWYCANSGGHTHPVKRKPPNAWGLYDMAGNAQQWCWDTFAEFTAVPVTDPAGPGDHANGPRVWRGGGFDYDPRHCRSADRGRDGPDGRFRDVGVRLARAIR